MQVRPADLDRRREPPPEAAAPHDPAEVALALQRTYGNRAVGRMLSRNGVAGSGPGYRFGAGGVERESLANQDDLNKTVRTVIEDYFDGHRAMFMQGSVATTVADWADVVYSHMEPFWGGEAFGRPQVLQAVRWVKDKYRRETLLHMARTLVYDSPGSEPLPWSGENLKERLVRAGAYLEADDDAALQAIVDTDAAFAATKVEIGPGNIELSDEDNIVVLMDDHQNKHQMDKIPQFKPYTGEPGTKFAPGKDLQWHIDNTMPVVRQTIADAVSAGDVSPTKRKLSPSKDAIDGIHYDLTIVYDKPTGKYVGTYHCNPHDEEF